MFYGHPLDEVGAIW